MLDHFSLSVKNYDRSLKFYDETLAMLGYKRLMTFDMPEEQVKCAGYGNDDKPYFWISPMGLEHEEIGRARGVHIAFLAPNAEAVKAWHEKCLELGGLDNGTPGFRPEYHSNYFGGFIIDPDGWRLEAVFHAPIQL